MFSPYSEEKSKFLNKAYEALQDCASASLPGIPHAPLSSFSWTVTKRPPSQARRPALWYTPFVCILHCITLAMIRIIWVVICRMRVPLIDLVFTRADCIPAPAQRMQSGGRHPYLCHMTAYRNRKKIFFLLPYALKKKKKLSFISWKAPVTHNKKLAAYGKLAA